MTQAIHHVDLRQWFMGEAVEVSARHATFVHGDAIEVEETVVATVRFPTGALATISASTALTLRLGARLMVTGSTGATVGLAEYPEGSEAVNDLWAVPGEVALLPPHGGRLRPDPPLNTINTGPAPFHARQIADFVDAARTGRPPAVTGREAMRSLAIVYDSATSGRPVPVPADAYRREDPR